MLFNSYTFIFIFFPLCLAIFYLLGGRRFSSLSIIWLTAGSLFFYGWWNPAYLFLIVASVLINFYLGNKINQVVNYKKAYLISGVVLNLFVLGYYKYSNFFIENINHSFNLEYALESIILPLGISFFTFQQIAYLIDNYKGYISESKFFKYALFVSFFPQLIAGPIVHHRDIIPQFCLNKKSSVARNISVGFSIFIIGLFKKVVIADSIAIYANPIFDAASEGVVLTIFEAWGGALAYSLQLYFDFSGYSDMAVGLAMTFGVRLPINFLSPYKAKSIIEFWSRWHITLSLFLRDYVYIPLGGSRKGLSRRFYNLMFTMVLGGLWHGAGWTFLIWGGIHGFFLIINHSWRIIKSRYIFLEGNSSFLTFVSWFFTFLIIVFSWVTFRADSLDTSISIYKAMLGFNGIPVPSIFPEFLESNFGKNGMFYNGLANWEIGIPLILILLIMVKKMPNTIEIFNENHFFIVDKKVSTKVKIKWLPNIRWALLSSVIFLICIEFMKESPTEFLYFQF